MIRDILLLLSALVLLLTGCTGGGNGTLPENYTPIEIDYAKYLKMGDCGDFLLVDVINPWDTTLYLQRYILASDKEIFEKSASQIPEATFVKIPIDNIIVYSSVHVSMLEELGAVGKIVGVCEPEYILSDEVKRGVAEGKIMDCGNSVSPNLEKIIESKGEIIIASPFQNSTYGAVEKSSIPIIEGADYMENHPLGRTEWIKLYGYLLGKPALGDSLFKAVESNYNRMKSVVAEALDKGRKRPKMISEKKYGNSWGVPGGLSYISVMYEDAGAENIFGEYRQSGSVMLSFEQVLAKGIDADYWLFKYNSERNFTYKELAQEYPLYEKFAPFVNRKIYACNTSYIGYYDDITLHPDKILADFIKIFHPDLLPEHNLRYFLPLE